MFKTSLLLSLMLLSAASVGAAGEREALAEQRRHIEARHAQALKDCAPRFNVNACEQQARLERAQALKPLLAREQELDSAQRQARAQAQRERVQAKQQAFASQDGKRMQRSLLADLPRPAAAASKPHRVVDDQAHGRAVQAEIARGERAAQRRRQQAADREQEAQARRAAAQKRQQQHAQSSKPAASLPQPTADELAKLPPAPKP
ncbi:hypothetical protein OOZ63_12425 [Paucibacter sp. PLA-PC-4]|uniref:hypothetical protein n=1 Tax=Paucibacter sp. PLA-PC-4 TaxID=2993655 RepID=UPI0022492604|nr:hypothetical protein [Paucibacter sp. PLA-PC-4]MCX2862642.1 hypothetical protein [Paucibacter sp. PLA-PC-4]